MANPIKVLKSSIKVINAAKKTTTKKTAKQRGMSKGGITTGKAKAALRMAKAGKYDSNTKGLGLTKGSNKKVGASAKAGRGFIKSKVKEMVREEKKAGYAMNPKYFNSEIRDKGRNFGQFSGGGKKIPVKRRGK